MVKSTIIANEIFNYLSELIKITSFGKIIHIKIIIKFNSRNSQMRS
ncbi:MAG: hypothetical protein K0S93_1738 [Nitrososphaeraceae archaeon]|jgi:hypothetical protein|nr:hypothetical protein [Nitrososphaeraceae archaeon]